MPCLFLCNTFARAELRQQERARKLCSATLNPGKALAMAICPIICLFYELARALMDDVACEFACAVRMRKNN